MPQSARIRPALTEPIFGSAKRTSRTLAVRRYSGGWARICASSIFPDASSFFSCALADRISLASRSARRRCSRDLPGTLASALPTDTRALPGTAPGARINRAGWRERSGMRPILEGDDLRWKLLDHRRLLANGPLTLVRQLVCGVRSARQPALVRVERVNGRHASTSSTARLGRGHHFDK